MDKLVQLYKISDVAQWLSKSEWWARKYVLHTPHVEVSAPNARIYKIGGVPPGAPGGTPLRIDLMDANAIREVWGLAPLADEIEDKPLYSAGEVMGAIKMTLQWLYREERLLELADPPEGAYVISPSDAREWFGKRHVPALPRGRYIDEDLAFFTYLSLEEIREYARGAGLPLARDVGPSVFRRERVLEWIDSFCHDPDEFANGTQEEGAA